MNANLRNMLLGAVAVCALTAGMVWVGPQTFVDRVADVMSGAIAPAHAQEDPEDPEDDDDDDTGGDGVGGDDVGNDGAGDDDGAGGDAGDDGAGDDGAGDDGAGDDGAGDDGAGGDDDGPGGGDDDDGPGGGDDGPGGGDDDGPGGGDDGPGSGDDDDPPGGGGGTGGIGREDDDAPGGAGVRGLDAEGGLRIRDGDRDFAGPAALPAGIDVDFEGRWIRTGEILALEADPTSLELARGLGFQVIERYRLTTLGQSIVELRVPRGQQTRSALEAVRRADPDTAYDFNHIYTPTRMVGDAVPSILQAGATGLVGANRSVGIIDTGVDTAHPALSRANILQAEFISREARAATSTNHHGTAVASILVGRNAASPASSRNTGRLFAANVVGRATQGGTELASADAMVRALDWLARNNAPVANISLAGPPNTLVQDAIRRAQARGMIIVAAVGNDGPAAPPLFPAAYEGVVGVTAVDANGAVYRRAGRGNHVDVAAYGVGVDVAAPGGARAQMSGTSFAAPVVAAALADRHATPDSGSAQRAIASLLGGLRDAGDRGRDPVYGAGVLMARETK